MREFGKAPFGGASIKFVVVGIAGVLLAGCSDSIERFSNNYSNPSDGDPVYTASIPKFKKPYHPHTYAAPVYNDQQAAAYETIVQNPVARAPLARAPQYDYTKSYAKTYRQPKLVAETPVVQPPAPRVYAQPRIAYNKPTLAPPVYQKPVYKAPVIVDEQTADAATPVSTAKSATLKVAPGMTLYAIAKANHVSVQKLAAANGIAAPYSVAPGRTIKIPGAAQAVLPQVAVAAPAAAEPQVAVASAARNSHVIAQGDTLYSLGRKYNMSPFAIADANGLAHDKPLAIGKTITIPAKVAAAAPQDAGDTVAEDAPKSDAQVAAAKPAPLALPKTDVAPKVAAAPAVAVQTPASTPSDAQLAMRWPVRGKIISAFGNKPNGMKNEGINIAVPEGTKIQAAEAGVVAYAGNELKGYGNLVLIRHAGGYVTAYAHASNLLVKKGDQVKRGDVIATAGQTGAVQSPQVHFEVRKGATAMDPATFLNSASASN